MHQATTLLRDILERFPQADPLSEFYDEEINGCDAVDYLSELIPEIRTLLDAPPSSEAETYAALQAAWHFIEDVPEDDPERTEKFFALRARVRNIFWNLPRHPDPSVYVCSWDYSSHGAQQYFTISDWRSDVASSDTVLGYQQWVSHQLESLLHDVNLNGVDAIEVAGCTESDGIVEVIDEADAEFYSAYTHKPGKGVECICDFNTKPQALEFARALAARTGIPVYGNLCSI